MYKQKQQIDIVNEILEACILAYPVSSFIISLYKQYIQRGSLSKKQLQGLYSKAVIISSLAPGKLATLQALINKMPTRYKSDIPPDNQALEKKEDMIPVMDAILQKYPQHKRILFLKAKYENNTALSTVELEDIKRLGKVLLGI